jgi:deoxycytidylate deaminase
VLSIGTNEVSKPGGGQYWYTDPSDGRDFRYGPKDLSDKMRRNLLGDLLDRLTRLGFTKEGIPTLDQMLEPKNGESAKSLKKALLFETIDFVRAVHAEAAAILALPRAGCLEKASLYVTTFPCHECARHIVMAGLKRVIYVEPYPKSLVSELFGDSVAIDENCGSGKVSFDQFVGIGPTLYKSLFAMDDSQEDTRKDSVGNFVTWTKKNAFPQLLKSYSEHAARTAEKETLDYFNVQLEDRGMANVINGG